MKGHEPAAGLAVALALAAVLADAATLGTEPFDAGLNGWTNHVDAARWIATNQAARVSFGAGFLPQNAALEGGPDASAGAFSGDYTAAGVEAIGFSFFAENVLPSVLKIELTSGTNVFFQDLRPRMTAAGVTNRLLVSLAGHDAARWSGAPVALLPDALTNVLRVALRVTTSGSSAQAYRLDDLFLDLLPAVCAVGPISPPAAVVTCTNLRIGFTYRVQSAGSPTGSWEAASSFAATNRAGTIVLTNAAPVLFLRLEN